MEVQGKYLDNLTIPDNEMLYLSLLQASIEAIDELCSLEITKLKTGYNFRIAPSTPLYSSPLLEEVLKINNKFHIHLDISKSIKTSGGTINFEITLG